MQNKNTIILIVLVLIFGGFLITRATKTEEMTNLTAQPEPAQVMMEKEAMDDSDDVDEITEATEDDSVVDVMNGAGSYEDYDEAKLAKAADGKVVLFFKAGWCPTCTALENDINENLQAIPSDVTVLKVDYDKNIALKSKYGVKIQHTLVQVDEMGNELNTWTGSLTLDQLLSQVI